MTEHLLATYAYVTSLVQSLTVEHCIVAATGIGYFIVGILQWSKGNLANGLIWCGYAAAQIGLYMNLKT